MYSSAFFTMSHYFGSSHQVFSFSYVTHVKEMESPADLQRISRAATPAASAVASFSSDSIFFRGLFRNGMFAGGGAMLTSG